MKRSHFLSLLSGLSNCTYKCIQILYISFASRFRSQYFIAVLPAQITVPRPSADSIVTYINEPIFFELYCFTAYSIKLKRPVMDYNRLQRRIVCQNTPTCRFYAVLLVFAFLICTSCEMFSVIVTSKNRGSKLAAFKLGPLEQQRIGSH